MTCPQPDSVGKIQNNHGKVLLVLLPLWDPLIPPLGISCLKSFIQKHGYEVKTIDANIEEQFRTIYSQYFECLKKFVPPGKRRHLYNIGHEVLKNHMMAHINYKNQYEYIELVKVLVYKTFFSHLEDSQIQSLNQIIKDYYLKLEQYFIHLLDTEKPTVLGLSAYSGTLASSLFAFKLTKERHPHIKTVMGGAIFSGELSIDSPDFKYFLEKTPYIDKIIVGEGENLFLKFLRGEIPASKKVCTLADINMEILDISSADIPDFSDYHLRHYIQMGSYTSRSCPFQCSFCVETKYWGKFRKKNARKIVEELLELQDKYGSRLFLMCDSLLNPVITDLAKEVIKSDRSLYWGGYLRVNEHVCNIENTGLWREGGFYRARLGVESGSQKILDMMGKKINIKQIKLSVSALAYAGIKTTTMFVIGYPGETEEDFQETLDLVEELRDDIYEADCNPFWYFLNGQVNSDQWLKENKSIPLYPGNAKEMLIIQTWIMNCEPSREETYRRVNRFVEHCNKLRIPNPYSLLESNQADERWRKLHKNAVPSLLDLKGDNSIFDEGKKVNNLVLAVNKTLEEGDWVF